MPIPASALMRGGTVLVTAAATVAMLAAPAHTTEAEARDGGTRGGGEAETRQIASSVLDADQNVKFTLTAIRSTADPLRASVRLKAFARQHGRLVETDEVRVGPVDRFFWFPVTGKGAICEFSTASTNPAPITVSLLITPAIGCSPPEHFELQDGKFEADGRSARTPHGGVSTGGGGMAGRTADTTATDRTTITAGPAT
ncbi:hypothetical protein PS467_20685 [Streptomyces luomodiensis]|uniref:Uncharacterized protein n=1 Tax=Streptomyces luomodiensis TaxID=3026192 RepID=A0ABY9V0J7_9ACTN|nr:hypothetical protein [Streptomyces sp. SCA4-21]WNE97574.1 hypothetical protein PS467_20685 [Streptomyces sp. SCA4-21]